MLAIRSFSIPVLLSCGVVFSCSPTRDSGETEAPPITYKVERAPEWTALFNRTSGWFGGDGIFAIPYSGVEAQKQTTRDSILLLFSDTMVGEIHDGKLEPGYTMVNNSVAVINSVDPTPESIRFFVARDKDAKPAAVFVPATPAAQPGEYYWLGDGFVNHSIDSNLYIFAYRIVNTETDDQFPFRETGNSLIVIPHRSKFPFKEHRQVDIPFFAGNETAYTSLGAGVLVNTMEAGSVNADGYIYVYGVHGSNKELIAARVSAPAFEKFSTWEFWNGTGWSDNPLTAAAIADSVSNELSVTPLPNGQFALIYQYAGIFPTLYMQVGESPVGPFGPREKLWDTGDDVKDPDLFTYNAKAHPALSKPGELLVSYNVNSFKFFDVVERIPNLYRPRFVKIIFDKN